MDGILTVDVNKKYNDYYEVSILWRTALKGTTSRAGLYLELLKELKFPQAAPKIINYIKSKTLPLLPYNPCSRFSPIQISLSMVNRCNLRCAYCGDAQDGTFDNAPKKEFTIEKIKQIFQTPLCRNAIYVNLAGGGEPLLCKDIVEIVEYLNSRGHLTLLTTNGILLPKFIERLTKAGLSKISISIYPANIDFLRDNLASLNKIHKIQNSHVITRSELENTPEELEDLVDFVYKAGSTRLRLWNCRPFGKNQDSSESFTSELPAFQIFYNKISKKYKGFVDWQGLYTASDSNLKAKKICRELWQLVPIDGGGCVTTCCGSPVNLRANVNAFVNTSEEIFNHPAIVSLRKKFIEPDTELPDMCKYCNLLEDPPM
ncbi:MAG: radical SAM protein [Spirochaetaceae bacterium]|jgi:MoaA/NifB/PqqE/SkfB family radical SAM enzyme|nr:radical SAM protein [Spirochaetaceae bacterium]